jgi:UDP:flavonoid glycosyltransferase YjiC (YdhE family)
VRVERYIPQTLVLPRCRLVVSHGGSGTVIGALAHGVPMVLLPRAADQPHNARRCEDLGVGLSLDPLTASAEAIREAAIEVLTQPSFRLAAERLRNESAALPGPDHAIELLQRLQEVRQPILAD